MPPQERTQVFISYSHEDAEWLKRLQIMLKPLTRNRTITLWDDTQIQPGRRWREDIQNALTAARVAVLLVSPNFLASDFIAHQELPPLLKAGIEDGLTILWVAVSASLYTETEIAAYQAVNNPATPLDSLNSSALNVELVKIAQKIKEAATQPITTTLHDSGGSPPHQTPGKFLIDQHSLEPEMIIIPAGPFLMGSQSDRDKFADEAEQPQHVLLLSQYYLAKTPVTNAQYWAFASTTGRKPPEHWEDGQPPNEKKDHPVVGIDWFDAEAFCRWLSNVTGKAYELPSEAEWEKGARGTDGRIYPWGDVWDPLRCNCKEWNRNDTTSVEAYPTGASVYGNLDIVGNVSEWTRSIRFTHSITFRYPYKPDDGREHNKEFGWMAIRGGSFQSGEEYLRCAYRSTLDPFEPNPTVGFRVMLHP